VLLQSRYQDSRVCIRKWILNHGGWLLGLMGRCPSPQPLCYNYNMLSVTYADDCLQKLDFIDNIMEQLVIQYIVLGDTAYRIMYGDQSSDKERDVRVGIRERDWTEYAKNVIDDVCLRAGVKWEKVETATEVEEYECGGVRVRILHRPLKFLKNPQQVYFHELGNHFWLPNPFDVYWKSRRFVW
jgi:hypothetical protein